MTKNEFKQKMMEALGTASMCFDSNVCIRLGEELERAFDSLDRSDATRPDDLARYLTKRERIAIAVLQGTLANPFYAELINRNVPEDIAADFSAKVAVIQADELIKALNNIKP